VLIVDDHPMVREGIKSMLEDAAEICGQAASGEDALRAIVDLRPDLVLLDLQLPDLDGLSVLQRMRTLAPESRVLIVTMHDRPSYVRQAMRLGAAGYLLKGATRRELLAAVAAALEGESVIEPRLLQRVLEEATAEGAGETRDVQLTPTEREVLTLLAQGLTNKEIAARLRWSVATVKKYVQRLLEKLRVSDRTQAAVEAVQRGLIGTPPR
jgi:DNA-binding NarL/FixJ family response regulator